MNLGHSGAKCKEKYSRYWENRMQLRKKGSMGWGRQWYRIGERWSPMMDTNPSTLLITLMLRL